MTEIFSLASFDCFTVYGGEGAGRSEYTECLNYYFLRLFSGFLFCLNI